MPCPLQVETRATGEERETGERAQEQMGAQERVVEVAQPVVEQPTAEYFSKVCMGMGLRVREMQIWRQGQYCTLQK